MHELSIAVALAESLRDYLHQHPCRIIAARVKVGCLSGIDPEALQFAWEPALAAVPEEELKDCKLVITRALIHSRCCNCGWEVDTEDWQILCPECHTESLRRTNGSEFCLESIEVL